MAAVDLDTFEAMVDEALGLRRSRTPTPKDIREHRQRQRQQRGRG